MCLNTISEHYDQPLEKEVTVYKAFQIVDGAIHFPYYGGVLERGKWLTAKNQNGFRDGTSLETDGPGEREFYPYGFHGFTAKADAKEFAVRHIGNSPKWYKVLPVKFRKIHTKGEQRGTVLVATEMYVPTEEELNAK